ncbi:class I SAM-dependent methyltransferase [Roseofilum casamattae]|uniref:Class I SAM-dependent methyltransferase n=1 Tax=Roseofilum casamattae BLCC-M143 TaxID=3022442 RepID=A0ABT7BW87_9CYAN|nr:class I SAM-dependent methyltransferase [Roseofilum casamattae]MDJ1183436.1 class I SAM-dependent methyltransferase [Roseofilum casamattae BLCC-M143]
MNQCPVCQATLESRRSPGLLYCTNCDIWVSNFSSAIAEHSELIVEENREEGLNELRLGNSNIILDTLQAHVPLENLRICDVGCAYGWFVEAAGERGMDAVGIEPEESVALQAKARGLKIKIGYFPDCLDAGETYDAIAFNDSLEHLPDLPAIFTACHHTLTASGKLIINIPNSQGLFFKIAEKLAQLGYTKPWDRMWQKEYAFPHLIYVNPHNLEQYVTQYGFELLESKTLDSVKVQGLWQRLRMDRSTSWIVSAIMYLGILLIYPFIQKCPSDILLQIYQKK